MNLTFKSDFITPLYKEKFLKAFRFIEENNTSDYALFRFNAEHYHQIIHALGEVASGIKQNFSNVVILGMGGAILNPKTLFSFNQNPSLKFLYLDTLDPEYFAQTINQLDLRETKFISISKSGETLETIALCMTLIERFRQSDLKNIKEHFLFITESNNNTLYNIASQLKSKILIHEAIGGRFAAFSNINLLPLMLMEQNAHAFCEGGLEVLRNFFDYKENSLIAQSVAFLINMVKNGYSIHVNMSYRRALHQFLEWNNQIIAESLGKEVRGITPISAHGPEDQHSQLQLYLDGPKDKFFTLFVTEEKYNYNLPKLMLQGIENKSINDFITAQQQALNKVLLQHRIPVRSIILSDTSIKSLGALMMFSMIETIVLGVVSGINPFGQPAVEGMKKLVYDILR